jgi:hypothetical protein
MEPRRTSTAIPRTLNIPSRRGRRVDAPLPGHVVAQRRRGTGLLTGAWLAQCQAVAAMAMVGLHFLPLAPGFRYPPPHVPALAQQGERKTKAAQACDQQG